MGSPGTSARISSAVPLQISPRHSDMGFSDDFPAVSCKCAGLLQIFTDYKPKILPMISSGFLLESTLDLSRRFKWIFSQDVIQTFVPAYTGVFPMVPLGISPRVPSRILF